ncbi:MAG TPA: bifunctional hydroxymethylpyrimidine kinase/phosphomethylpyrimidine kinase [bacterium]|nr:bifunctional hydroxymethylpyrimidine kinase/phosphomethylpyrimidine kinase [bacterium]
MKAKVALTIGGLDPSGGAGITADVVTFSVIGVYGAAVATAITYQNTRGVSGFWAVGERDLKAQLDAVLDDVDVAAVKLGMLASDRLAYELGPYLSKFKDGGVPVVFDPVMKAGAGQPLYEGVPEKAFADVILPQVSLATPNSFELAYLVDDEPAQNHGELRTQVRVFHGRYGLSVLATGGHVGSKADVVDILFTGAEMREYRRARVEGPIHGTGCLVAAAVTAYLAFNADVLEAFERGEEYVSAAVTGAVTPGKGASVPGRTAAVFGDAERWRVYNNLLRAVNVFEAASGTYKLIPEVGTNIAYAIPDARSVDEVCAVSGRVARVGAAVRACGTPAFGASRHMARAVLAAMKHDASARAAMNVRFGDDVLAACSELNYRGAGFDRAREPADIAGDEGRTVEWGVDEAVAGVGIVPPIIFDRGAVGKEPMVRIFGRDAMEVVRRAVAISRRL